MKAYLLRSATCWLTFSLASVCGQSLARAAQSKPATSVSPTNSVPALAEPLPLSVFVIPASPKDGRNPFFPQSAQALPQITKPKDNQIDVSVFVLNGITPNGPKRTAMINGRTFEPGESGEVRVPSGAKILIKCEEIKTDSAVIIIDNQRRELKLRFGL